jgi:hypothetical protein
VLRGISPRLFSICFNSDTGKVIPSFSVLSILVLLTIPVYLVILSYKSFLFLLCLHRETIIFVSFGFADINIPTFIVLCYLSVVTCVHQFFCIIFCTDFVYCREQFIITGSRSIRQRSYTKVHYII